MYVDPDNTAASDHFSGSTTFGTLGFFEDFDTAVGNLTDFLATYTLWGKDPAANTPIVSVASSVLTLTSNTAHTFRRTFACLLRKAGVDTMPIKDLGRWESLEMVQRYTRSVTFEDCMKHYKAPLSYAL
jgi:hypothetical protein